MSKKTRQKTRIQTVEVTTRTFEHVCGQGCFTNSAKPIPRGLHRVNLGYVYRSSDGKVYIRRGKDEWLHVLGMAFSSSADGELLKIFESSARLHIHSPSGRGITKATTQKAIKVDESFHAQETANSLKRKGTTRKAALDYVYARVAATIDRAPRHRRILKGSGRGAPDRPRTDQAREVLALIGRGFSERETITQMTRWFKLNKQSEEIPKRSSIKRLVHRYYTPKKR